MFRNGTLHTTGQRSANDDRLTALTVYQRTGHGVYVLAGWLHTVSETKPSNEIQAADYVACQRVSLSTWGHAREFFQDPEFAPLVKALDARIAAFDNPAGGVCSD